VRCDRATPARSTSSALISPAHTSAACLDESQAMAQHSRLLQSRMTKCLPSSKLADRSHACCHVGRLIAIGAFDESEGQQVPVAFVVAEAAQLDRPLGRGPAHAACSTPPCRITDAPQCQTLRHVRPAPYAAACFLLPACCWSRQGQGQACRWQVPARSALLA
jgi:hypothetical protein